MAPNARPRSAANTSCPTASWPAGGHTYACTSNAYDNHSFTTTGGSWLTVGLLTASTAYASNCGPGDGTGLSGAATTTYSYDAWGNPTATQDPDANAGNSAHVGCPVGGATYTTCTTYDGTFDALPTAAANALNQTTTTGYTATAAGGYNLWPTSTTDPNGQTTSATYDTLGRMTSQTLPSETAGATTSSWTYTVWCSGTAAQQPCVEVDQTQRQTSSTTITTRAFYDGFGRLVETRAPGSGGQDVVRYRYYDPSGRDYRDSVPYFVAAYTGAAGSAAFSPPDGGQNSTITTYDGLGRVISVADPLSHTTSTSYSVQSGTFGGHGANTDEVTTVLDPLGHKTDTWTDAWGRTNITRTYTGNSSGTYAQYAQTQDWYSYQGPVAQIIQPDGTSTTSYTYDLMGRVTGMTDPDRGTETYSYDANGNRTQTVDARGAAGTTYASYDGLNRQLWRNTTNSATGAYVTYAYDGTSGGNGGIGRLTGERFTGQAGLANATLEPVKDLTLTVVERRRIGGERRLETSHIIASLERYAPLLASCRYLDRGF